MELNAFKTLVAAQNEREKVVTWSALQEHGVVQLLRVEKRQSRFGECWLAKSQTVTGLVIFCWIPLRLLEEIKRKHEYGHSIYFLSLGVERFRDKFIKTGDNNRQRNAYELQLVKDGNNIPLSDVIQEEE